MIASGINHTLDTQLPASANDRHWVECGHRRHGWDWVAIGKASVGQRDQSSLSSRTGGELPMPCEYKGVDPGRFGEPVSGTI